MAGGASDDERSSESVRFRATGAFTLLAVDPGDRHCGLARFKVRPGPTDKDRWRARLTWSTELTPAQLVAVMENQAWPDAALRDLPELTPETIDVLVVEEFRLYPWMAREQGYSDFKTPRLIGKLELLADWAGVPLYLQGASIKKPSVATARRLVMDCDRPGEDLPELVKLTSGRYDFVGRNQHVRDAIAHGWYWLLHHPDSPLVGR